jgi:hypothetical protein
MSLYGADSLQTVASELAKCKLDLLTIKNVKWDKGGSEPANVYVVVVMLLFA